MLTFTTNAKEKGTNKQIEFAGFGVFKAWQFYMYKVRRDPILESETLVGTYWIRTC